MKRTKMAVLLVLVVLIFLMAACQGADNSNEPGSAPPSISTDTNTPSGAEGNSQSDGWDNLSIATTDLSGAEITDESFAQNRLTMFNVWATWCPPCIEELPELQEISRTFADQGVQVVGVLQDGVTELGVPDEKVIENAQALLKDAGANYTVILPDETLMTELINQMQYFPTTFFIDSEGTVAHTVVGAKDFEDWSDEIKGILSEISS
jgi:thiol-disulfide isomerase/thioredoxin